MRSTFGLLALGLLCHCSSVLASTTEVFDESLSIQSLPDGHVASRFKFTTVLKGASPRNPSQLGSPDVSQHYTLFPLALGQILREWGVTELHLTLNSGKWNYAHWGYPEEKGVATGAELWAWMGDGAKLSIDERWQGLRNSLAGLFCASLGSMGKLRTTSPLPAAFAPEGDLPLFDSSATNQHQHQIRHASLPSEYVCTENLTPFLKLLPCKGYSGLAKLLNPHRLFDADWHGMGVHVTWDGGKDGGVKVELSFQSVSDPARISGIGKKQDWTFQSLFDRTIDRACPVAETSMVRVSLPRNAMYAIRPEPDAVDQETSIASYDVAKAPKPLNIGMNWAQSVDHHEYTSASVPFTALRTLTGSTQYYGQLVLRLDNQQNDTVQTRWLETMPWLVQLYLHSIQTTVNGIKKPSTDVLEILSYSPPIPHGRPATFDALLSLPPRATVEVAVEVNKAFLRYTEHPPDAQRGWDLPPGVLRVVDVEGLGGQRIYLPTLLVDLATPDFSMPYNVIIFSCSVVAFIFGTAFNLLTRRFVVVKVDRVAD